MQFGPPRGTNAGVKKTLSSVIFTLPIMPEHQVRGHRHPEWTGAHPLLYAPGSTGPFINLNRKQDIFNVSVPVLWYD
jgi:hypothetical protein